MRIWGRLVACPLILASCLGAQTFYNYVGQIESHSVLLAWGTIVPKGTGNTIGRDSTPLGKATVRIADRNIAVADHNWALVEGLTPDTVYPYEIDLDGKKRGGGQVRTWPEQATHLCFFVIGDFGNGLPAQYAVAQAMDREFQRRGQTNCPVRFVLTVGDNIYGVNLGITILESGDLDAHWETKFYKPYQNLLLQVPFMASLGNHDGNGNEHRGDLYVYLDNFFFPQNKPARWYTFTYAGMAQFFALDSTINTETGPTSGAGYAPGSPQSKWLSQQLADSKAAWKIPYFHHPIYNAGPGHPDYYKELKHWVDMFQSAGVKVVFTGHEHNFQFSNAAETGGILYVVSGSGGELREGDVRRKMAQEHIAGWAATRQFLSIEIEGAEMRVTPVSPDGFTAVDRDKRPIPMPITQHLTN